MPGQLGALRQMHGFMKLGFLRRQWYTVLLNYKNLEITRLKQREGLTGKKEKKRKKLALLLIFLLLIAHFKFSGTGDCRSQNRFSLLRHVLDTRRPAALTRAGSLGIIN